MEHENDHSQGFFDALICEQGHVINHAVHRGQRTPKDSPFCAACGGKTMLTCGNCNGNIRGAKIPMGHSLSDASGGASASSGYWRGHPRVKRHSLPEPLRRASVEEKLPYEVPAFCEKCGHGFPWTLARLLAGSDFVDLMEKISPEDKARLKADLTSLAVQGPGTAVAVARWKLALGKLGTDLYGIGMKVIGDLAAATVKGQLGL